MYWAITILFVLVLTTLTGSLLTGVWYVIGRQLEKAGFINIVFQFMKVVAVFWCLPMTYPLLLLVDRNTNAWNGVVFSRTPLLQDVAMILVVIWFIVALWGIAGYVRSNYRIWKTFRRPAYECDEEMQGIFDRVCEELRISPRKVDLRMSMLTEVSFIAGTFRMTVYVPLAAEYFTEEELRVVFFHELTHYRQRDVWLKHLVTIAKKIHFFNPVIYWFARLVEAWSEFSCDDAVYPRVGGIQPYFNTIVELLTRADEEEEKLSSGLFEEEELLVRRAQKAAESAKRKRKSKRLAALIVVGMGMVSVVAVYGETLGIAALYNGIYCKTNIEETEQENMCSHEREYVESKSNAGYGIQRGTLEQTEIGAYRFDCRLKAGEVWMSDETELPKEEQLIMLITVDSVDADLDVGVIKPDEKMCEVSGKDNLGYSYDIPYTGSYRIYVKNQSGETQKITGTMRWEEQ